VYERVFPRIERVVPADQPVLLREDSGFDSARLLWAKAAERDRLQALGRAFDVICKWNPRQQDKAAWIAQAEAAEALVETRPGKLPRYCRGMSNVPWAKSNDRFG
jgi:hypothetical protein